MDKLSRIYSPDFTAIDMRTTRSAISRRLIKANQLTVDQENVTLADLSVSYPLTGAKVDIAIEGKVATVVGAMVLRDDTPDILLGTDHPY